MLINCVVYENGRKRADISVDDISDWLHKPDSFVWVALLDPSDEELEQMQQEFGLHELAVEDARKGHQTALCAAFAQTYAKVLPQHLKRATARIRSLLGITARLPCRRQPLPAP